MTKRSLSVIRAHENNLKQISVSIPHDSITTITGVSGSGKSSLAFHTLFAEGQRRYIETFSPYTRQFLKKVKKPRAELIDNIRPAIAIEQKTRITSSRSSVGSLTGISEYLKVLWANCAEPVCPDCGIKRTGYTVSELTGFLVKRASVVKRPFIIVAPLSLPETKKGKKEEIERLIVLGYHRYWCPESEEVLLLDEAPPVIEKGPGKLYVVLERQKPEKLKALRIKEAVAQSYSLTSGHCCVVDLVEAAVSRRPWLQIINNAENPQEARQATSILEFSRTGDCPYSSITLPVRHQSLFSPSHPAGACKVCQGFGHILEYDRLKIIPNQSKTIEQRAVHCWSTDSRSKSFNSLLKFCVEQKIPVDIPWKDISEKQKRLIFETDNRSYKGVDAFFKKLERKSYKMHVRVFISRYRTQSECKECGGSRLSRVSRSFLIDGYSLADVTTVSIKELYEWTEDLKLRDNPLFQSKKVQEVLDALLARLGGLIELGLPYLSLHRPARTLSGGETQRVNLAAALGSGLSSTLFVLDEPSVGLHARDSERLLRMLQDLKKQGNTVVVVEHDPELITASDHIIELGPGAGSEGGEVVYSGSSSGWDTSSLLVKLPVPKKRIDKDSALVIKAAGFRNLKDVDVNIPLNGITCITGISGSGKSTLVSDVLLYNWNRAGQKLLPDRCSNFTVPAEIAEMVLVDQSSLAKSPRANVATYTKMWDAIRTLFAGTEDAVSRGLTRSSFSFNTEGGRCSACKGAGYIKESMQFLNDIYVLCDICLGRRFSAGVLEVTVNGLSIHDVLQLTVLDAGRIFSDMPSVVSTCGLLEALGLGHLTLGHPLSELSGGEAQRLKLISYISQTGLKPALLIFDEPTTGLHVKDVAKLLALFENILEKGHTIVCIEHNLQVISAADWIVDLGPEGGNAGGEIIFQGDQKQFRSAAAAKKSSTAASLKGFIKATGGVVISGHVAEDLEIDTSVVVQGAREHNLKNIDVIIPSEKIVAFTGVSGSGKSTLARDILFVEGQRRYLDCLSPYARQYIKELARPDVDHVEGVPPPISVSQHSFQPSRLSTIATVSEVYTYLRLFFSKAGTQFCPDHPGEPIGETDPDFILERVKSFSTRVKLLAPIVKGRKGLHRPVFERALQQEVMEVRLDGVFMTPAEALENISPSIQHTIEFSLGSFNPGRTPDDILRSAVQEALSAGNGTLVIADGDNEIVVSQERTCGKCGKGFYKLDPEDLSFNSRRGRCTACNGTGRNKKEAVCKSCRGSRLNPVASNVRIQQYNLADLSALTPPELTAILPEIRQKASYQRIVETIFPELLSRLKTLSDLGLDYLPLDRDCTILSAGELQRLRVATAIGSPLSGVLYIFDEPSAALHPLDNRRVLDKLAALKARGNSVYMIEHDAESILSADHVIDIGPGGGKAGGKILFNGPLSEFKKIKTLTSEAVYEPLKLKLSPGRARTEFLTVRNAAHNNVAVDKLEIPLSTLVTFAGVSGAGKSSLVHGIITSAWQNAPQEKAGISSWRAKGAEFKSTIPIQRMIEIDQKPIGANIRSTPASYLGILDELRKLFAASIEARALGYQASFFSYATGKGRCQTCGGTGVRKLEMSFLPDARITCPMCLGSRYSAEALAITFHDLSIADALALTFDEAKELFAYHSKIHRIVHTVCELGLGYITLGQGSPTLSGGESQRLKLSRELSKKPGGHTLYVLDEPSIGLHRADVHRLINSLQRLTAMGHTVWIIEHDENVIAASDQIIEIGPGAGPKGGKIIFQGAPGDLPQQKTPWGTILSKEQKQKKRRVSPTAGKSGIESRMRVL